MSSIRNVLAISGSDCSGGAGMQCDLKTITTMGLNALSVVTSVTSQSNDGVQALMHATRDLVQSQLENTLNDIDVDAVKSGMLPTRECIEQVSTAIQLHHAGKPYVLDPVASATSGSALMETSAYQSMVEDLFPLATVVTPNIAETETLTNQSVRSVDDSVEAGRAILQYGCQFVLVKGGHLAGSPGCDVLLGPKQDSKPQIIEALNFVPNRDVHGTGCALASAIACGLAQELDVLESVLRAKRYVGSAIKNAYELVPNFWTLDHRAARVGN